MHIYRYSPIEDLETLHTAIEYVAVEMMVLLSKATDQDFPIEYITVFAHYQDEYERLVALLPQLGEVSEANNGVKVTLTEPLFQVSKIRIRKPDPYRMQVGCGDFAVPSFNDFKETFLHQSKFLRCIERPEYEMIEFFDPDIDVLGYVVSNENT